MLEGLPIMLALCFMLWHAYYAQNYAGIIDAGLIHTAISIYEGIIGVLSTIKVGLIIQPLHALPLHCGQCKTYFVNQITTYNCDRISENGSKSHIFISFYLLL